MKYFHFIDCTFLFIFYSAICSAKEYSPCHVRRSSENADQYVVECTIRDQASLAQLPSFVKSTQIHGDNDEGSNLTTVNPETVDELRLNGPIKALSHNAFAWLPNLRLLVIDSHSSGTDAPAEIKTHETSFGGLANLTSLTLITKFTASSIVPMEVFPDSLRAVGSSLRHLVIQDANLSGELGIANMQHFPNLRELTISNSPNLKLSSEETTFGGNKQLQKLDLKQVSMVEYPKSLIALKKLKFLRLEDVGLTNLPTSAFSNSASTLTELHIDKNPTATLDSSLFRGMKALKILTLIGNGIARLPDTIFSDLSKLDELSLSENRLESLPDNVFQNATRLVKLDLSKNRLVNISRATVSGLEQSLLHLDLSQNRIRSLHVAKLNAQLGVSLASNEIDELKSGFFETGSAFNRLILSSNPLEEVGVGAFSGVSIGYGNLYIQRANFTWLDLAIFHGMKSQGGADEEAQIIISNCPYLLGINVSRESIRWPSGVKQVVFTNNPRFALASPDQEASRLTKLARKSRVLFVFDGYGLCDCRWNWLRVGRFEKKEARNAVVDFGFFEESSPATCCNIPGVTMEDFLDQSNFGKHCNGTVLLTKEAAVKVCPNFDASAVEEPEARKR